MEDVKGRGNPGLDRAGRVAGKKKKEARTLLFTVEVKASTLSFNPIY